jgi:hypothetical protein
MKVRIGLLRGQQIATFRRNVVFSYSGVRESWKKHKGRAGSVCVRIVCECFGSGIWERWRVGCQELATAG